MSNSLILHKSIILKCRIEHAFEYLEKVDIVTIAHVKSLEIVCDTASRREIDEARKELGELWSSAYSKADKKALAYLDKKEMRIANISEQWKRIQRTKRAMPYLLYQLGPRRETCSLHLHWDNLLLPVDDPWWSSHMPPNSWGCTCFVRAVSKYEYDRIIASGKAHTIAPNEDVSDPSWNFNPGIGRNS